MLLPVIIIYKPINKEPSIKNFVTLGDNFIYPVTPGNGSGIGLPRKLDKTLKHLQLESEWVKVYQYNPNTQSLEEKQIQKTKALVIYQLEDGTVHNIELELPLNGDYTSFALSQLSYLHPEHKQIKILDIIATGSNEAYRYPIPNKR